MELVNRGFIWVRPKEAFWSWASKVSGEEFIIDFNNSEGNIYLIEEDFIELEPLIKKYFQKILKTECIIFEENYDLPNFTLELFYEWFDVDFGSGVIDLLNSKIEKNKI